MAIPPDARPWWMAIATFFINLKLPETFASREKKGQSLFVLQGHSENGLSQVFIEYAQSKIRNSRFLPRDFLELLQASNYFERLDSFLGQKPRQQMNLHERLHSLREETALETIWDRTLQETLLKRLELKFPGYHHFPDELIPVEYQIEKRRLHRLLISEINSAIWSAHPNWAHVERAFLELKKHFLSVIQRLDIPTEAQQQWISRISDIRLVVPGSIPQILDDECSSTTVNAFYYTHLNVLTVCAGDFNSEDILQTLAHEMSHAIDTEHSMYLFARNSEIGQALTRLRVDVCQDKKTNCENWQNLKDHFTQSIRSLRRYKPFVPEFQKCLKKNADTKPFTTDDLDRLAEATIQDRIATMASEEIFLHIVKPQIPRVDGKKDNNPNYMDPCGYYLWSQGEEPVDDELNTLLFFTAEYQCSSAPEAARLKNSITVAKNMSTDLTREMMQMEGELSSRPALINEGFASPPTERFADVIGSYVFADLLKETQSVWDRRNTFLASNSWQCTKPSFAKEYPDEASIMRSFVNDIHSDGDDRKKEILTSPIQEVIDCKKDFVFSECKLGFK